MTGLSPLEFQVRDKLADYIVGNLALDAFRDWLVPIAWDVEAERSSRLEDLVYEIELRLAEYSQGLWTETELKGQLEPLVERYALDLDGAERASSSSSVIEMDRLIEAGT